MKNKKILLISPEEWGPNWVSKHHFAAALGRSGNEVFFLGPGRNTRQGEVLPGVTLIPAPLIVRGLRYYPRQLRRLYHEQLGRTICRLTGGCDVIWSFEASRYLDLDRLCPGAKTIFYLADRNDALPWREVAASADLCLSVCKRLTRDLAMVSRNAQFTHHGCDGVVDAEPYAFSGAGPHVVYGGSLVHGVLDRERLLKLVARYPHFSFHLFGETGTTNLGPGFETDFVRGLRSIENVLVYGPVDPQTLSRAYKGADALLVPYTPGFDQYGNPHKMMAYLASGRPILSTRLAEYNEISDLIVMEDDVEKYVEALLPLLEEGPSELKERRQNFAVMHTYEKLAAKYLDMMECF